MAEDYAIRVNHVSKVYKLYDKPMDRLKESLGFGHDIKVREHYALRDVNFDIKRGECVGIIGTNGAGKSTILKIITGVLNPSDGDVKINGRISALLELGAGFNQEYTGIENVYLNGTMIGFTKEEIDEKLDDILKFADIGDFVNQPVKTYSSGMFVRLAFAVAININPEILIVDEALSVGDVFFQAKCYKKFEEFKKQGKTILFVSHDLSSISKYCDRAILLNKGVKISEGRPNDVIDLYKKVLVGEVDAHDAASKEAGKAKDVAEGASDKKVSGDEWKYNYVINPNHQDYGDKIVEISDFAIVDESGKYTSTLIKGSRFKVKVKIKAHKDVTNPIVAFTIRTLKGTEITGTNTMFENADLGEIKEGEERVISFAQELNLQGGQYLLSLGCTRFEHDEFLVYHRLYDICSMTVISDKNTVGFYDMKSEVELD